MNNNDDLDIKNELLLLRAEIISVKRDVDKFFQDSLFDNCGCQFNSYAKSKYGFIVGYAEVVCNKLLSKLERKG